MLVACSDAGTDDHYFTTFVGTHWRRQRLAAGEQGTRPGSLQQAAALLVDLPMIDAAPAHHILEFIQGHAHMARSTCD